jgi:hypothetical protein
MPNLTVMVRSSTPLPPPIPKIFDYSATGRSPFN